MPQKFAHCEYLGNGHFRNLRQDTLARPSHIAKMQDAGWYLREWRDRAGLTMEALADRVGTSPGQLSDLEKGKRRFNRDWLEKCASALQIEPADLFRNPTNEKPPGPRTVPLVGYVGAGAEAHFYSTADEGLGEVEAPADIWTPETRASEIRGVSLGPLFETWLIFYDDVRTPVTADLIGRVCILGLENGQVLVKQIRKSRTEGLFHLYSNNEEPMLDQDVIWAARVKDMRPR